MLGKIPLDDFPGCGALFAQTARLLRHLDDRNHFFLGPGMERRCNNEQFIGNHRLGNQLVARLHIAKNTEIDNAGIQQLDDPLGVSDDT